MPGGRSADQILAEARELVEPAHRAAIDELPSRLRLVAGYHAGWWDTDGHPAGHRGKAVRPALVLACARAATHATTGEVSAAVAQAVPAAVAVELAHDFTLLHDDVMDGDLTRRHRPAAWTVFGTKQAILTGDALLVLALDVLAGTTLAPVLSRALLEVCTGQSADLAFETEPEVTLSECLAMAERKTAALFGAACHLGALAAGTTDQTAARYRRFGRQLGMAFQLADDILGIWGDPGITGKPSGADLTARKKSLPVVAALTSGTPAGNQLTQLYQSTKEPDQQTLTHIRHLIEAAGGRAWAQTEADRRMELAVECLDLADAAASHDTDLGALVHLLTRRNH